MFNDYLQEKEQSRSWIIVINKFLQVKSY